MGAGQSTGKGPQSQATPARSSYYTLLGVERTATDSEIKKGYRKLALELHPDRNYGKEEWATSQFAEIQTAYEILSDPQERSWYDSHEASILQGSTGLDEDDGGAHYEHNVEITSADDVTRMMGQFRRDVEFSDSPNGFYGFVKALFDRLCDEERQVSALNGVKWDKEYTSFGGKDSSYQYVVRSFYVSWGGFATVKQFAWKDKYRVSDVPDRQTRRAVEKENKKAREAGIREFNEAVRALVAFVKKRDPRYQANIQSEKERQEAQRNAAAAQAARSRAENQAKLQQAAAELPEWVLQGHKQAAVDSEDEDDEDEDDEEVYEEFECVACNKTFKSEKQYEAHEKSKKHQKAVWALRKKLRKEGQLLGLDDGDDYEGDDDDKEDGGAEDPSQFPVVDGPDDPVEAVTEMIGDIDIGETKVPIKEANEEEEEAGLVAECDNEKDGDGDSEVESTSEPTIPTTLDSDSEPQQQPDKKIGKAAQKRAKKAAKLAATTETVANQEGGSSEFACAVCQAQFPSRSQMFQHIEDFKHAIPVTVGKKEMEKEKGGKKKGKK